MRCGDLVFGHGGPPILPTVREAFSEGVIHADITAKSYAADF